MQITGQLLFKLVKIQWGYKINLKFNTFRLNFVFYGITCENYRRELIKIFKFSLGKSKPNVQTSTIHLNYLPTRIKTETRVEIKGYYTFLTSANKKKKDQVVWDHRAIRCRVRYFISKKKSFKQHSIVCSIFISIFFNLIM